jgi:hypothetical protein
MRCLENPFLRHISALKEAEEQVLQRVLPASLEQLPGVLQDLEHLVLQLS